MARGDTKSIVKNTTMLMFMNIATLVFPLLTLPYLTRALSTDIFGFITYVKALVAYMLSFVEFGFIISSTKRIVENIDDLDTVSTIVGDTIAAKLLLFGVSLLVVGILMLRVPVLSTDILYVFLACITVLLQIYLMDFLFRGLEMMHVIAIRYLVAKVISTGLTFVFVKGNDTILWIPLLEIFSSLLAIAWIALEMKSLGIRIARSSFHAVLRILKHSVTYFATNIVSLSFNMLITLIVGIVLKKEDIAYWGMCMQLVIAAILLFSSLMNGVYPAMVQRKDFRIIKKEIMLCMPFIVVGCIAGYYLTPWGLGLVFGEKYVAATPVFRMLIPVILLNLPSALLGWPSLGAIGRESKNMAATIFGLSVLLLGIVVLLLTGQFTLLHAAVLRSLVELVLLLSRAFYCYRFRHEFHTEVR